MSLKVKVYLPQSNDIASSLCFVPDILIVTRVISFTTPNLVPVAFEVVRVPCKLESLLFS